MSTKTHIFSYLQSPEQKNFFTLGPASPPRSAALKNVEATDYAVKDEHMLSGEHDGGVDALPSLARDLRTRPSSGPEHVASCSSLGLVLGINDNDEVVFLRSLPNSPAARLSDDQLVKNDVLIGIDSHIVYQLHLALVMKLLAASSNLDRVCTLHFHRRTQEDSSQPEQTIKQALEKGTVKRLVGTQFYL